MVRSEIIGLLAILLLFLITVPTFIIGSSGGSSTTVDSNIGFIDLNDTPTTYVGQASKFVQVNVGETGLQFTTVAPTGDTNCSNNPLCLLTGTINTNFDANFNDDVNIQRNITLDGNLFAKDANTFIGALNGSSGGDDIIFNGLQFNAQAPLQSYALGVQADTWAFCVLASLPTCSGLKFVNSGRRGFDFTISAEPVAHFGVANGVGAFWLPARTSDPTAGSQDKNSGTMYVKSTDINRLVMNIGTYTTPNFKQVGSNLSEDANFARSLTLGLDLNLVRDVNVGRQILMRTTTLDVNACAGISLLASGTTTVVTSCALRTSLIFATHQSKGSGATGTLYVTKNDGNFTITSTSTTDDTNVAWMIIKPA